MEKSHKDKYDELVKQITLTKDNVKSEFNDVKENWIRNIKNYDSFINSIFIKFMTYKEQIDTYKDYKISILPLGKLFSMDLYKMDIVSRYPEKILITKILAF